MILQVSFLTGCAFTILSFTKFPRTCSLIADSVLDFGCIAANSQVVSKYHAITNQGAAPDSSVRLSPCSGVIAAASTQWLKVELRTDGPGQIDEKALIKLQNCSAVALSIKAEVVDQCLEILDLQEAPLSCLWFGPVYFGTSCMANVVLRNNSPQACDWVCVLQDTAAGTEVAADLQKSTDATLLDRMEKWSTSCQDVSQVLVCFPKEGNNSVELGVTGSGLPVSLVPSPQRFNFLTCVTGQRVDMLCVLQNLCPQLPVNFQFRKLAHFTTVPSKGIIPPGQCQDIVLSFTARQQGNFQVCQILDVLGHIVHQSSDNTDVIELVLRSFHTITLHLSAVCCSETKHPVPKLNLGISSPTTNPTGSWAPILSSDLKRCRGMAYAAVLCADKTQLHLHCRKRSQITEGEEYLAFPNDRASSIRPASLHRQYRTIFTGVSRYRYVDTNYAFTDEEMDRRLRHRQIYTDLIKQLRQTRLSKIKDKQEKVEDDVDIGLVPSQGLVPPKLHISDIKSCEMSAAKPKYQYASPGPQCCCPQDLASIIPQVTSQSSHGINAVPTTSQEVADCSRTLTAQELYKVVIVDFGMVCVQSTCVQKLELVNHLSVYVWVQLEVDCPELQGSSPLSHVLPPFSHNTLPLTFQSNILGHFYRPVSYSINQHYPGQIVVRAQVVPLALELSTTLLVLTSTPPLLTQSGYRTSITLRNQHNHPTEFTWRPIVTERGILFSIRPATGTVEPYRELDCEVVWHPSFTSPEEGDFDLCVHEGNTQRLHCIAKVGSTSVQLAEKRVIFGSVPLSLPSVRTAVLHNTGQNHAYYQVLDVCPLPGMVVSPSEGVVPSGGQAVLKIHFKPDSVFKFDTRMEIALRNMKSIELRVGGSVEPPNVNISVSHFQFYGVYVGSRRVIPFTLKNQSSASVVVVFDLSEYAEFSLQLPQTSAKPGASVVEVPGYQTVDCSLVFSPTQAATYEFDLPVMVNGVRWPNALQSPLPHLSSSSTFCRSSAGGSKHIFKPLFPSIMATQQSQHIQATVLVAPLELSPSSLEFYVETLAPQPEAYTKIVKLKAVHEESMCWRGVISQRLHWLFDCSEATGPTEDRRESELCTVSPSSGSLGPGQSICLAVSIRPEAIKKVNSKFRRLSLPLYLENEQGKREQEPYQELSITIVIHFPNITIHPPQILLTPVPLENSPVTSLTLMAVGYPSGTTVSAKVDDVQLENGTKIQPFSVVFPEGNSILAKKQDQWGQANTKCFDVFLKFKVKLYATADNCLLTVWPYIALNRTEQQIVLKTGRTAVEAILQRYQTPSPAPVLLSSSSSFDHDSSTNKNSASDSFPDSDTVTCQTSRNEVVYPNRDTPANLGVPAFPAPNSNEGLYHQNVLLAAERWFSLFGWPSGPYPISIPHTLRRVVSKVHTDHSSERTYRVSQNKDSRVQGACLCHIRPEYLLDVQEFKHWCSLQPNKGEHSLSYSSADYESLSKRSWTDVLLQIFKVLVLCRVSESCQSTTLKQAEGSRILPVNSQPLASNIYSAYELKLLSWLNVHYENMRETIWDTGVTPSTRWIVNFDLDLTDGLVLATLVAGYCPHLINSHFRRMYTTTSNLEQILHNNIIVVQALTALSLNIDVQPTDLSDPNPVQMLMLCVHLNERLPQYLPHHTITLSGGLHSTFSKQNTVKCKSPCYQLEVIQLPILNTFSKEAMFRVVLVESTFNPLGPEKKNTNLVHQASASTNLEKMTSDKSCVEEMGAKLSDGDGNEFLSEVRNIYLKSGQAETLKIHYLPFCPGTKYCSLLLVCPQVGDMVYIVKATAELPLPSPLATRPSSNIVSITSNSGLSLCCIVGQVHEKVVQVPRINMAWEQALAIWGQLGMSSNEHRRRILTHTLHSSTVRTTTALHKLFKKQAHPMRSAEQSKVVKYSVEVSLPQYFTLPTAVEIPIDEDTHIPWENPEGSVSFVALDDIEEADKGCVLGRYKVFFSLEVICEPGPPVKVIDVQCVAQSSVAIEIPVSNPEREPLMLNVNLEGDNLSGASWISVPPEEIVSYTATFSPDSVGKCTGCVMFQSELVQEVWYQLELYALPPPVITVPQACCQLGKCTRLTIPLVNPNADTLELMVTNSNPRNYTLEMDSGNTLQEWCVLLSGCGLNPECENPLSISSVIGSNTSIIIPFTNPTELPATLSITLTDTDPSAADCLPLTKDKEAFSVPLSSIEGIHISEGGSFDVPVVFAPDSMELQQAWLCMTMKPLSRFEELQAIRWIYPLRGISVEMPIENSQLGMVQCEAGCQLEKKVDVLLTRYVLRNQDCNGHEVTQVPLDDFLCKVYSNSQTESSEVENCFSASIESARRDPETGIVSLTLCLLYTPLRPSRHSVVIAVQHLSERTWEFPIDLLANEPQLDDVIYIEATELGKTSAVGFRLTSTTRLPEPFTVAFVSSSSTEFTVTPSSGILPPVGSSGALITVFFTPTMYNKVHKARLSIEAADRRWIYEVRGKPYRAALTNPSDFPDIPKWIIYLAA
ncbi:Cilia- and flagella-associated protein 47 [Channa argus]|uniref:Cilia-and flagella-associated protein 47 n=1 Tax=Channa argus TaxID=215402 RepID=A0A6G1QV27_CHAAH|nr:Cilia- and flagella-associated protein 47 [Channa argus]